MSENGNGSTPLHGFVVPPVGDLRHAANELLSEINAVELAQALKDGDRIASYQPFTDWLNEHDRGSLYVNQMIECLLFDVFQRGDKGTMSQVLTSAVKYLKDFAA